MCVINDLFVFSCFLLIIIGQLMLFFGCRSEKADFFFRDEWEPLAVSGKLKLFPAFSRDQVSQYIM